MKAKGKFGVYEMTILINGNREKFKGTWDECVRQIREAQEAAKQKQQAA